MSKGTIERPKRLSIAVSRVCTATQARVPHPSRAHREGWDGMRSQPGALQVNRSTTKKGAAAGVFMPGGTVLVCPRLLVLLQDVAERDQHGVDRGGDENADQLKHPEPVAGVGADREIRFECKGDCSGEHPARGNHLNGLQATW